MDILELRKVNKRFGGVHAIKELDLTVTQGTVHGLIGPNGSGKTTTFNVITRVPAHRQGQIFFGGRDTPACPGLTRSPAWASAAPSRSPRSWGA